MSVEDAIVSLKSQWTEEQTAISAKVNFEDGFVVDPDHLTCPSALKHRCPYLIEPKYFKSEYWSAMVKAPLPSSEPPSVLTTAAAEDAAPTEAPNPGSLPTLKLIAATDISFIKEADVVATTPSGAHAAADSDASANAPRGDASGPAPSGATDEHEMSRTAIASLAIMTFPALEPVYQDFAIVDLSVPYVPGFLAFREVPALLPLFERLRATRPDLWPQLLLADGNGFFHPRRSGIASHLGVILDLPTVGVAKELFILDGLARAPFKRASRLAFGAPLAEAAAEDGAVTAALAAVSGASTEAVEAGWRALYPQLSGSDSSSGGGSGHASEATAFQDAAAAVAAAAAAVAAAVSVSAVPVVGASGTLWAAALIPIPGARSPLAQAPAPAATAATAAAAAAAPGDAAAPAPLQPPNPVFVSVGHRVSLRTAVAVVAAVSPLRVPEPLRAADLGSREVVRRWVAARVAKASAKAAAGATTGARADAAAQPAREHQGCEPSDDRGNADSGDGIV